MMLTEQELEGIRTLALQVKSAEKRWIEMEERTEQLFGLQIKLSAYVEPLLQHVTELEQKIQEHDNMGRERMESS